MDSLILAFIQNTDPLNLTTDVVHAREHDSYFCYAYGMCIFHYIFYRMDTERNDEEVLIMISFQSYASIQERSFDFMFTGIFIFSLNKH